MPNYLMRCLGCKVILLFIILMLASSPYASEDTVGLKKLHIAKKNFLSRERDYLRAKPLSSDLRSFIKRFRRKASPVDQARIKRQEDLKGRLYIVKNGEIEPLENMAEVTAGLSASDPSGLETFTVIPLIIPITLKTFTNSTICDTRTDPTFEGQPYPGEKTGVSQESVNRTEIREATQITSEVTERVRKDEVTKNGETKTEVTETGTTKTNVTETGGTKTRFTEVGGTKTEVTETAPTKTSKSHINNGSTIDVLAEESSKSTTENEFLKKVLSDVEQLISYEKEGKNPDSKEGTVCGVLGDWDSDAGGMQLQLLSSNDSLHRDPFVQLVPQTPEKETGFLRNGHWKITSKVPYDHSSLIMLTAISDASIAVFIGDCRICEGSETLAGSWLLGRRSANCKDREDTHSFVTDIMRKSNIRRLQQKHLKDMTSTTLKTTTV